MNTLHNNSLATKIAIQDIPLDNNYEGYYWMSNKTTPEILVGKELPQYFGVSNNPFIVEAELYDSANGISYHIQNAGNKVICMKYEIREGDINNRDNNVAIFESHRMNGLRLKFLEYWEEESDASCCNFPTLKMTKRVFIGFERKEEKV